MKIKGAIFDLDGTLLDSMYVWDTIGSEYLKKRGIIPEIDLDKKFKNKSLLQAAQYYQKQYDIKEPAEKIMDDINNMIEQFYFNEIKLKQGVYEILSSMKAHNIKMCIATATDDYLVEAVLKRNKISEYFSEIFTCTKVGFGKNTPHIYEKALAVLKTKKSETIVFEDALYAIKTAKDAGFIVAGIFDKSEEQNYIKIKKIANYTVDDWKSFKIQQFF